MIFRVLCHFFIFIPHANWGAKSKEHLSVGVWGHAYWGHAPIKCVHIPPKRGRWPYFAPSFFLKMPHPWALRPGLCFCPRPSLSSAPSGERDDGDPREDAAGHRREVRVHGYHRARAAGEGGGRGERGSSGPTVLYQEGGGSGAWFLRVSGGHRAGFQVSVFFFLSSPPDICLSKARSPGNSIGRNDGSSPTRVSLRPARNAAEPRGGSRSVRPVRRHGGPHRHPRLCPQGAFAYPSCR